MAVGTAQSAPAIAPVGGVAWVRANLFSTPVNTLLTLLGIGLLWLILPPLIRWGLINAAWSGGLEACKKVQGSGACWIFIAEKYRLMLFGLFWRADGIT